MKKIILIACSLLLFACDGIGKKEYRISGVAKGVADGTSVFLKKQDPKTGMIEVDTIKVEKEKFTFEGKSEEPELHFVVVDKVNGMIPFILEEGKISMSIDKDSIFKSKASGTYNNDELVKYNEVMMKIQKKIMSFQKANEATMQNAVKANDTVAMNKLRKEYATLQESYNTENNKYIKESPKSFLSVLLIQGMLNSGAAKIEELKKLFEGLDKSVKGTKPGKEIQTKLKELESVALEVGSKAPEFSAPNPEGKMVSLKESLGKITIVDFWASWCKPCRMENPNVVALYNEFHAKGLNIIGVSLDKEGDSAKWKEAIAKDKITWTQVSNLKSWEDPIAISYNVKSIPATFILDANGVIVAKDLRGDQLKAKVAELLK